MANDWYCCKVCPPGVFPTGENLRDVNPDKAEILRQRSKESYFRAKESDL
ncbi:AAEL011262-PA [Aedes aegypti]|uniref:AAEL011262-PA n=1 Tax=Aedes aegypti TaxID=7159 RepID=Q16QJ3_AEDAE|nr:AAEL011262-PA [Aedes aegypti]